MRCPSCGAAELIRDTRDIPYTYKGETASIPAVTGNFCPACGEIVMDREHGDRYSDLIGQFRRQVNAVSGDPVYIATIRKKLNLDQREAAELFGGGVNAFSRYENGRTRPPLALVQLFKLLDRHPDLLKEVRPTLDDVAGMFPIKHPVTDEVIREAIDEGYARRRR